MALTRRAAPEDSGSRLLSIERGIRSDAVFRKYPALGTPPDSLTELRTRATKEKGVEAGFLVALLDRERGEKPRAGDLAALAKGDAAAKARGRLLAFEGKDPKALERVLSPVADRRFVDRLAKAQARERAGVKPEEARKTLVDPTIPFRAGGMLLGFLGAIALSLLAWITFLVSRAQGAFPPLGAPPLPMTPGEADRFALRAAMLFGGFLLGSNVLGLLLRGFGGGAAMIGQVVFFTAVAFYALRLPRDPLVPQLSAQGIGIDASGANSGLGSKALWGMGAAFANIPIILIVTVVSSQLLKGVPAPSHPTSELLSSNPSLTAILFSFFLASVCAPIWEETMFRGLLFPGLVGARLSPVLAAVVSSFAFAAIHPQGLGGWLGLMSVALMSCALVWRTRSLVPSIVMHATHNALTLAAAVIAGPLIP